MPKRKTPKEYHEFAAQRGYRWLGPEVPNTKTKTRWECPYGHQWETPYVEIYKGHGCPFCAGKARKTPQDYHALAEKRGFRWLGPQVPNVCTKTQWECPEGHQWEAPYSYIQQGTGCPICAGNLRKSQADYHVLARERGFRWLGPEVPNNQTRTRWECPMGHTWETSYASIQQGHGCPVCGNQASAEKRRRKPKDYHRLAAERGFKWLGPEVPNIQTHTRWECQEGHQWVAAYAYVQQGTGCPICAGNLQRLPEHYHNLAAERGFKWLGPEVPNANTNTNWQCPEGHCWEARYNRIQQGHGCPICAGNVPKTPEDYQALATERGFQWLGPEVAKTSIGTRWECPEGHRWKTSYNTVQQGHGCPFCAIEAQAEQRRLKPSDYHAIAAERGFRWLGPEVPNVQTRTRWECDQGHRWEAPYSNIRYGSGCPICIDLVHGAQVSQVQRDLCEMLGGELNHPCGPYRIDVALNIGGVAIAIEYDSWFWHGHNQDYDAQRDEELIATGWRVLHIKSNELLPSREQLDAAIARLLAGKNQVEIVLDDWGKGPTRFETD